MQRLLLSIGALAAMLVLAGASVAANAKTRFQLKGEVYATAFKIEMENAAGRSVKTVKAGTYRIKIEDPSRIHNFHLRGPGVNKATSVAGRTETTWTVRLRPGTYTFLCDPHPTTMRGTFRVT